MNRLEKAVFLKMRQYQFTTDESSEVLATYGQMTNEEKEEFYKLSREIHSILNYINSQPILNVRPDDGVTTVQAYHEQIKPVSEIILKVVYEFGLNLTNTITKKAKDAIIAFFGIDYYNTNYGDITVIDD